MDREKRSLVKAMEACKSHTNENKPFVEKFEQLIKDKTEEISKLNDQQKANVVKTKKFPETEEEVDLRDVQLKANTRDPDCCIKDSQNQFYDDVKEAAVIGDTIGDPLKDTSGPSVNILIKLSAILSVVFGASFKKGYLSQYIMVPTKN
jgi:hypothetical protein